MLYIYIYILKSSFLDMRNSIPRSCQRMRNELCSLKYSIQSNFMSLSSETKIGANLLFVVISKIHLFF
jgi:hypothetical protein